MRVTPMSRPVIVPVPLESHPYEVVIADGALGRAHDHLAPYARAGRLLVVSDEAVWAAQGERLTRGLAPVSAVPILVPPGEASKSWPVLAQVIDRLLAAGIERSDHIVALGGGVVGDLAGFAAAIANRGCGFVQIPTTLLAQVDSSVGGKTGINVAAGKNLVGAFHQPALVLIDPACLATLPPREVRAGYAEIAKYALIEDPDLFAWLEVNAGAVIAGDPAVRVQAIAAAVAGKARIVAADERETTGRRALLNLGHTFGHALEAAAGYGGTLLHGEAVAVGIVLAFGFSVQRGLCAPGDADRVAAHFAAVGLPTTLSGIGNAATPARLAALMGADKKRRNGRVSFILTRGVGRAFVDREVDLADVERFLERAASQSATSAGS